jgi:hypothetical protein
LDKETESRRTMMDVVAIDPSSSFAPPPISLFRRSVGAISGSGSDSQSEPSFGGISLHAEALKPENQQVNESYRNRTDDSLEHDVALRNIPLRTEEDLDVRDVAKFLESSGQVPVRPRTSLSDDDDYERRSIFQTVIRAIFSVASSGIEVS